jgi:DNA-binding Xre family transcriptional regulator
VTVVKHNLLRLVSQKEQDLGRRLTLSEIAAESNVSIRLVSRWLDPDEQVTRFDAHAIVGFCKYFECSIADLLELVEADEIK